MNIYKTSQIANKNGIHPNTVRLYENFGLIPKPDRTQNGYRIFTDLHMEQIKLVRMALSVEILQNGLRKKAIDIIKLSASKDFDSAIKLTKEYILQIKQEQINALEAIDIVKRILSQNISEDKQLYLTRHQTATLLKISMDTLRNWELNGLLTIKRKYNGYRVYTNEDIIRLKVIRSLRCANYSLESILRMLNAISKNPNADLLKIIDTPNVDDDIISVCDKLLTSLNHAEKNADDILIQLQSMKKTFNNYPTL